MELADNSPLLPRNSYSDPHQAKNTVFTLSFNPSRPHDVPDSPMQSLFIQKVQSDPDFQENRVIIDEELEESKAESPKTKQKSSKKRKMKDYTQVNILIDQYYKDPSPNQVRMHELAEKTGLSYYQVYKWFWEQKRKFSYKGPCSCGFKWFYVIR